ncbi:HTH-type transcriptional repressor ComR [Variibacter gotjawalensis]|uniref:HTH-type transcriptional repressor ComR n=1 Tax=Variibacter gotjawalensis TaxID=1333996 RepID=A0A0S3Q0H4_9BRAD|nr:TetR/AcrR family transcriptional regulator [Variibacter gotjawalensis]NIK47507.1 AcrR family transcriptional regulator [Variibacter gotjawalensis]RZS49403.1 TetR family transcriptional regulator [Variibacter gotjawalensis]BAT61666.1 HTH-type transcriptional repressor ComR [Variibacter gotjawalensis]
MVQKSVSSEAKRRGRPRAYDPAVAIEQAAAVFWKAGYAGTSLDDLAAATGMNRPSLYAAFGDKRELYLKTLEFYRTRNRDLIKRALAGEPPLRELLQRIYAGALDIYYAGDDGARGCYTIGTATTVAAVDEGVREFLAQSFSSTDAFFFQHIVAAQKRGEISAPADPAALAALTTATLHTLAVRSRAQVPRAELEKIVTSALAVICAK